MPKAGGRYAENTPAKDNPALRASLRTDTYGVCQPNDKFRMESFNGDHPPL